MNGEKRQTAKKNNSMTQLLALGWLLALLHAAVTSGSIGGGLALTSGLFFLLLCIAACVAGVVLLGIGRGFLAKDEGRVN